MSKLKTNSRNSLIVGLLAIAAFVGIGLAANADTIQSNESAVDYKGFQALTDEVYAIRAGRLVSLDAFNRMKAEPDTIILDTRSRFAYETGHIEGAINLPFSDFTSEKLAAIIPSKDTRILIYCNNNFSDDYDPVPLKRVELALNIPTFINLYGYGYENIYELGEMTETFNPAVGWIGAGDMLVY